MNDAKINSAITRREVGKSAWRNMIHELIESERDDLNDLKELRQRTSETKCLQIINAMLERKIERVIELNLLLQYRDREKENYE